LQNKDPNRAQLLRQLNNPFPHPNYISRQAHWMWFMKIQKLGRIDKDLLNWDVKLSWKGF
jgi:hypothetical protein